MERTINWYQNITLNREFFEFCFNLNVKKGNKDYYNKEYTIQLGAFKDYGRAASRMHMLQSEGFADRIEESKIENELFFVVKEIQKNNANIKIQRHNKNIGYGGAVKTGFKISTKNYAAEDFSVLFLFLV